MRIVSLNALKVVGIARRIKSPSEYVCFRSDQQMFLRFGPFAPGMAARKGEDPLAGLQRSQQPGPQGDAQFSAR